MTILETLPPGEARLLGRPCPHQQNSPITFSSDKKVTESALGHKSRPDLRGERSEKNADAHE